MMRYCLALVFLVSAAGCQGDTGPQGPPGPGEILVYEGDVPTQVDPFTVSVPEIDPDNLPVVLVYIQDSVGDWIQLNVVETDVGFAEVAVIHDGSVEILTGTGVKYRIVLILF